MPSVITRASVAFSASSLFAFVGSVWWGNRWLYDGWPAPPNLLSQLLETDGERSYDAMYLQLFLILLLIVAAPIWTLQKRLSGKAATVFAYSAAVAPALLAFALFTDSIYVGLFAGSADVDDFHFGTESMRAHGGWAYASRNHYFVSGLLYSVPAGLLAALCSAEGRRVTNP